MRMVVGYCFVVAVVVWMRLMILTELTSDHRDRWLYRRPLHKHHPGSKISVLDDQTGQQQQSQQKSIPNAGLLCLVSKTPSS